MKNEFICPLCNSNNILYFFCDKNRDYYSCNKCKLIFVPPHQLLSQEKEKARYDLHTNNPNDINYRKFLNRIFAPIHNQIPKKSHGLDFGCGPGPTLSRIFQEAGHEVELFDYFYINNEDVFHKKYDFITATEVIEHLHKPYYEIIKLWKCLKAGGILGIMTSLTTDKKSFLNWHYTRDLTHICFYSKETFKWLATNLNAEINFPDKDIVILKKSYS
jgi:2-polyprenyl-3-methyl-5-hydroxy-6-metoxy-1,4-benzoquinol methylase